MSDRCQRCGEDGQDRRTLWMACLYAMHEMGLPFEEVMTRGVARTYRTDEEVTAFVKENLEMPEGQILNRFYTLRVCKDCRADWMSAIARWFGEAPKPREGTGTGVFIRDNGTNREATEEEVERMRRERRSPL